jgi:hypothetical protein
MDWTVAAAAELLGITTLPMHASNALTADLEQRLGRGLPRSVRDLLAYDGLIEALAKTYDARRC